MESKTPAEGVYTACVGDNGVVYINPEFKTAIRARENDGVNGEAARVAAAQRVKALHKQQAVSEGCTPRGYVPSALDRERDWKEIKEWAAEMGSVMAVVTAVACVFAHFYCK